MASTYFGGHSVRLSVPTKRIRRLKLSDVSLLRQQPGINDSDAMMFSGLPIRTYQSRESSYAPLLSIIRWVSAIVVSNGTTVVAFPSSPADSAVDRRPHDKLEMGCRSTKPMMLLSRFSKCRYRSKMGFLMLSNFRSKGG
ncbi:hypothetical protein ACLOJK_020441 [Asimina triloba]